MKEYRKEVFEIMIQNWLADSADEMNDLKITEITLTDDGFEAYAHDEKAEYVLTDDGDGNIQINYIGAR